MKCRISGTNNVGRQKVVDFFMTSIAYVLFEHGFDGEKIIQILRDIEDAADSMVENYISFNDIRKVLKDEYGFEISVKN